MTSYGVCMLYDISIEIVNPEIGAQFKKYWLHGCAKLAQNQHGMQYMYI